MIKPDIIDSYLREGLLVFIWTASGCFFGEMLGNIFKIKSIETKDLELSGFFLGEIGCFLAILIGTRTSSIDYIIGGSVLGIGLGWLIIHDIKERRVGK